MDVLTAKSGATSIESLREALVDSIAKMQGSIEKMQASIVAELRARV